MRDRQFDSTHVGLNYPLYKMIPMDYILWNIFDCILEKEPIFMAKDGSTLPILEADFVYRVTKSQVFGGGGQIIQILAIREG